MYFQIIVTGQCNFACTYCMQKIKNNEIMKFENMEKTVSFIVSFFLKNRNNEDALVLNLSGGEILLHFESLQYFLVSFNLLAHEYCFNVNYEISTNAALFTKPILEFLKEYNVNLYIGFDGIKKIQNLNRIQKNGKSSFGSSIKGLKLAYKDRFLRNFITINMVISTTNVYSLYKSYLFITKNFPKSKISMNIAYNVPWSENSTGILKQQLFKIMRNYFQHITENKSINLFDRQVTASIFQSVNAQNFCGGGKDAFSITIDGRILPCGNFTNIGIDENKILLGNINDGIDSDKISAYQNKIVPVNNKNCENCLFSNRCRRFCPFLRYMASEDTETISEKFCEINKILIIVCDELIEKLYKKKRKIFEKKFLV